MNMVMEEALSLLTDREQDVFLQVLSQPKSADIAKALGIGVPTVKFHIVKIFRKLGIRSRYELLKKFGNSNKADDQLILYIFDLKRRVEVLEEQAKNTLPVGMVKRD
jgi:DNA-binding CsgD family transcriptional regulator